MKKALKIIKTTLVRLVALIAISMMIFTIISVTTFNRNDRSLFGYKAYIVNTDSMAKTDFDAGSLIFVKEVEPETLKEGDIITFVSHSSESFGENVTHKIRKKATSANGERGFITYGTTTNTDDEEIVTCAYICGKYEFSIPYLGSFFNFLKTTPGYIVCILVPFMVLIIYQGVNCVRLFRRYKQEQMEELHEERAKIEAEREENAKMIEELKALKQQLAQNTEANPEIIEEIEEPAEEVVSENSEEPSEENEESAE